MVVSTPATPNVAPNPSYTRTAMGVITQYEIFSNFHAYLVEIWRGRVSRCTCNKNHCQHGRLAMQIESQYQEAHAPEQPASCMYCGRMARRVRGVAICPNCAS